MVADAAPGRDAPLGRLDALLGGDGRLRALMIARVAARVGFGVLLEPIGYAMDRRMLLGIKERAEGATGR